MSTNDLHRLSRGSYLETALTNPLARLMDVLTVLPTDDGLLALSAMGTTAGTKRWLDKFIFFQDVVSIHPEHRFASPWSVLGPQANEVVSRVVPELTPPMPGELVEFPGGLAMGIRAPAGGGVRLILGDETGSRAALAWGDEGLKSAAQGVYQLLRVDAGIPEAGAELTQDVIPLEVGLWDAVSFSKGCFIGQEILARMESRGKLARRLRALCLDSQARSGDPIRREETQVGKVTSAVLSPRLGWVALGLVREDLSAIEEAALLIGARSVRARLTELPFPASPSCRGEGHGSTRLRSAMYSHQLQETPPDSPCQ